MIAGVPKTRMKVRAIGLLTKPPLSTSTSPADAVGVADGQSGGRETADGVADQPQVAQVLLEDDLFEDVSQQGGGDLLAARRGVGLAVPGPVHGDDTVAGGQRGQDRVVVVAVVQRGVQEHEHGAAPGVGVGHAAGGGLQMRHRYPLIARRD